MFAVIHTEGGGWADRWIKVDGLDVGETGQVLSRDAFIRRFRAAPASAGPWPTNERQDGSAA